MNLVYFDNAATSLPVAGSVVSAVNDVIRHAYGNPGRSGHDAAMRSSETVYNAREELCRLLDAGTPENISFTYNATHALNTAILGISKSIYEKRGKTNVITSVWEHNSVLRPLYFLESMGIIKLKFVKTPFSNEQPFISELASEIDSDTALICLSACSNTTGEISPYMEIGRLARRQGIIYIIDAAQAAGHFPFSVNDSGADIVCVPGHKGLLGIMGCGIMALSKNARIIPEAIVSGGSGVAAAEKEMLDAPPERFEAGTPGIAAIAAAGAGARLVMKKSVSAIRSHESSICHYIYDRLNKQNNIKLYSPDCGGSIILFNTDKPCEYICEQLNEKGICVRGGMHCAPLAHEALSTPRLGAVRISCGISNTFKDAEYIVDEIIKLSE